MRSFKGVTIDGFTKMLDEYMVWYRDKRIKLEYGMSIMGKRIELGLVAWTCVLSLRTTIRTTKSKKRHRPRLFSFRMRRCTKRYIWSREIFATLEQLFYRRVAAYIAEMDAAAMDWLLFLR